MVAASEVLERAANGWPTGGVEYSQSARHRPDGYRQDCSGFASMCWGIPLDVPGSFGGLNTVNLVTGGWMVEIPAAELAPGDALGKCGEGTAGNDGHIQIFAGFADPGLTIWEQTPNVGPNRRIIRAIPAGYKAYRYRGFTPEEDEMTPQQFADLCTLILKGVAAPGFAASFPDPQIRAHVPGFDLSSVESRLVGLVTANRAADEARDRATLAAITALSVNNGGADVGPVIDAVNVVRDESREEYTRLHGELAQAQSALAAAEAEIARLREQVAANARAQAEITG